MHEDIVSFINGERIKMSNQQLEEAPKHSSSSIEYLFQRSTELFDFLQLADLERAHSYFREYESLRDH